MKNRNSLSPILSAAVLSLVIQSTSSAQTAQVAPSTPSTISTATPSGPIPATVPASSTSTAPLPANTTTYTVVKGDSLTKLAVKFNTTRKKLETLNNLTASKVMPGQVILVPSTKKGIAAAKAKAHHEYLVAQPVQDFDIPASTFASCPVPMPTEGDDQPAPAPAKQEKPAPVAQLVSPADLAAEMARMQAENDALAAQRRAALGAAPHTESAPAPAVSIIMSAPTPETQVADAPTGLKSDLGGSTKHAASTTTHSTSARNSGLSLSQSPAVTPPSNDWAARFLQEARYLGDQGIEYDDDWRPPGESRSWTMDCSNTSRYIYKATTGIQLPRTASDQYYYLHLQGKAWDVPTNASGWADGDYLRQNLKPGDLLFWENTYRPERQPPITHVMVFLGTNEKGQWIMAGSQSSRGGEHNRRNGGPDIYVFRPSQACGGYTTWLGMVHHQGRFCAFGRPLEADRSKLAVAAND